MTLSVVPDDFSPITQGDTLIPFSPQFAQYQNGSLAAFDLTNITISLEMQNLDNPSIVNVGTGSWVIDNAPGGQAHYEWSNADVANPGTWILWVKLTNSITGKFVHAFTKMIGIDPAP